MRYYNAWVEHFTDQKDIAELNFESSDEDDEETEKEETIEKGKDNSLRQNIFGKLGGEKQFNKSKRGRNRFLSDEIPLSSNQLTKQDSSSKKSDSDNSKSI